MLRIIIAIVLLSLPSFGVVIIIGRIVATDMNIIILLIVISTIEHDVTQ